MRLACLGWGSLIWRPEGLPCGEWQADGPLLPVEFSRVSEDGRITLVIEPAARDIPVLWAELDVVSLDEAVKVLAAREGVTRLASIGRWPSDSPFTERVGLWAGAKGVDGVVWTALKPGFPDSRGLAPTLGQLKTHINGLTAEQRRRAAEYVARAPEQVQTGMRQALQEMLGQSS